MHTKNQRPRLPGSALKVPGGVGSYPLLSQAPTPVKLSLSKVYQILLDLLKYLLIILKINSSDDTFFLFIWGWHVGLQICPSCLANMRAACIEKHDT